MENLKSTSKEKENESTSKMLWESWIVDLIDPDPEECCGEHEDCCDCDN